MQELQQLFSDWLLANTAYSHKISTAKNPIQVVTVMTEAHVFTTIWVGKLFQQMKLAGVNMNQRVTNYYRSELPENNELLHFYSDIDPTKLSYEAIPMALEDLRVHQKRLAKYGLTDPLYKFATKTYDSIAMRKWVLSVSPNQATIPWF